MSFQYKFAKDFSADYTKTGKTSLNFRLINQRSDFSFALFSGGLSNVSPCLSTFLVICIEFYSSCLKLIILYFSHGVLCCPVEITYFLLVLMPKNLSENQITLQILINFVLLLYSAKIVGRLKHYSFCESKGTFVSSPLPREVLEWSKFIISFLFADIKLMIGYY